MKFDKLNFLTAGMPIATGKGSYNKALSVLQDLSLDGMELEFVHGVRMSDDNRALVKKASEEKGLIFTAHAPFYVNLNSKEEEKIDSSEERSLLKSPTSLLVLLILGSLLGLLLGLDDPIQLTKVEDKQKRNDKERNNCFFI